MWRTRSKLSALSDQLSARAPQGALSCMDPGVREATLQFEVNDQMYFVNFVPDEGRWYVFSPTEEGMIKIPVAMDAAPFENFAVAPEEEKKRIVH